MATRTFTNLMGRKVVVNKPTKKAERLIDAGIDQAWNAPNRYQTAVPDVVFEQHLKSLSPIQWTKKG